MSRQRTRERRPLPPPLPPVSRTVGQVVAQAIELYQRNFFRALLLGIPIAVVDQLIANHEKSSAAGRKVTTPSTTADSHTRSGGRSA